VALGKVSGYGALFLDDSSVDVEAGVVPQAPPALECSTESDAGDCILGQSFYKKIATDEAFALLI